jgi:hypothetical protein
VPFFRWNGLQIFSMSGGGGRSGRPIYSRSSIPSIPYQYQYHTLKSQVLLSLMTRPEQIKIAGSLAWA